MNLRNLLATSVAAALCSVTGVGAQVPDPRSDLSPGLHDAGRAASGLELVHSVAPPPGFSDPDAMYAPVSAGPTEGRPRYNPLALANSDMAYSRGRLFVGSFHGLNAYELTEGEAPKLILSLVCPGGQGDVSVHGDLLFMSVEQNRARLDCGTSEAEGEVNSDRFRGIRIFDITDLSRPSQIAAVQTCRGSHTHTQVPHPTDANVLYLYNSATSAVRKAGELDICSDGEPGENPQTALYSIDVIKIPLDAPELAEIASRPRIFADRETGEIAGLWRGGAAGIASQQTAQTNHCHDITAYPGLGVAAGACSGNGILLDISDPEAPARISDLFDPDMAYWHSATFSNAGDKVVFTDEWGGGTNARCRAEDPATWGANLIAVIKDGQLQGKSFFKLPAAQQGSENCVAHNGNLIPVPGRDLMVQAWYQGGVSVMDFSDPMRPFEVAYFDRGPLHADRLLVGGAWSAYWLNGRIYASEMARGLDVLRLLPGEHLSPAEIAAAESIQIDVMNPQTQGRIAWPRSPAVARSYVDQLVRARAVEDNLIGRLVQRIDRWGAADPDPELTSDLRTAAQKAQGRDRDRLLALAEMLS